MSSNESKNVGDLCSLMVRLKLERPDLGRKEMLLAVQGEGADWANTDFDQIKRSWKKVMRQTAEEMERRENEKAVKKTPSKKHVRDASTTDKGEEFEKFCEEGREKIVQWKKYTECVGTEVQGKCEFSEFYRSLALERQLRVLREYPETHYILFTPPSEGAHCAIKLGSTLGASFFCVMWNRVINTPFGCPGMKRELWMIFLQLEYNFSPRYKKILQRQLQEEFGVDPFDGRPQ